MSSSVGGPLGTARGSVDRFDQGETAPAFAGLASELRVFLNGTKKILDDCLVATIIIDYRGRGALILVSRGGPGALTRGFTQINGDNSIMFEDHRAFCSGN